MYQTFQSDVDWNQKKIIEFHNLWNSSKATKYSTLFQILVQLWNFDWRKNCFWLAQNQMIRSVQFKLILFNFILFFHSKPELLKGVYAMGFNKPSRIQVNINQSKCTQNSNWISSMTKCLTSLHYKKKSCTGNSIANVARWSTAKYDCTKSIWYG